MHARSNIIPPPEGLKVLPLISGVLADSECLILGGAGIFSGSYLIIATSVPLRRRPMFTGLIGGTYGISSVVGPLLGGAFTDKISWRWCFYINLPIGGLSMVVIVLFFNPAPQPGAVDYSTYSIQQKLKQFDILGTTFFLPGVVCLLLALQWGGSKYAWGNGRIIALFILFGLCMIAFSAIQFWKPDVATISPPMLKKRSVWAASAFAFFMGSAFFVVVYYLPIWFQAVKSVDAYESGIRNIPVLLAVVVGTIISGAGTSSLGYYTPFMLSASVLTSIGAGLLTTFRVDTGSPKWIGYQVVTGFGIGLGLQQPLIAIQNVLDMSEVPVATALVIFCQLFGASIFISVGNSVLTNRLVTYIARNIPGVDAESVVNSGATNLRNAVPSEYLDGVIKVYNDGIVKVFQIVLVMACLTIIGSGAMEWRSVKGKKAETIAA